MSEVLAKLGRLYLDMEIANRACQKAMFASGKATSEACKVNAAVYGNRGRHVTTLTIEEREKVDAVEHRYNQARANWHRADAVAKAKGKAVADFVAEIFKGELV